MEAPKTSGRHRRQRRPIRWHWFAVPPVAAAGLAAALYLAPSNAVAPNDGGSTAVVPSAAPSAVAASPSTPAARKPLRPLAAAPTAVSIDAADLDVRVLPLTPSADEMASESLVPPLTLDAYWLTSYGVPGTGSTNTTYIVGHSWDGRDAPFNRLSDESLVGKAVTVTTATGTLKYVVDSVTTHEKNTLKDSDIWNVVPNRLVLISCYTEDPWGKNVVVAASPAP
ncbi:class F sortase [Arthrobacter globiformis]|uniref:Class F sortase n=1 Tax=Arthrobacter globiformis TaxID=1665 RepID=A0A328HF19_ARTGO|nr:class F sortase [Arthrobacter globiformis]RAM35870.1 class F sortase [Arthrobacter globiformis]